MSWRHALPLLALAACRTKVPAPNGADGGATPSVTPHARLRELCDAATRAFPKIEERESPSGEAVDPEAAARFVTRVRPLLPARLQKAVPEINAARAVRGGHLLDVVVADEKSESPSSSSFFLAYLPATGSGRLLADEHVFGTADFDNDGKPEPMTKRCAKRSLFWQECTLTAWFPAHEVSFTRSLPQGRELQLRDQAVWIVPADGVPPDFFTAEDVEVVSFSPAGTKTTDGAAVYAREVATARLRYGLEACEDKLREVDASRWDRRVRALGATEAEAPDLARRLVEQWKSSPSAAPRGKNFPLTIRATLDQRYPESTADNAIWAALPRATSHCNPPPAASGSWASERKQAIVQRAEARLADIVVPVDIRFGCATREGTLALVTWSEEASFEPMSTTELHLLKSTGAELVASTRSQWRSEYHVVFDLELGPSGDLDGDGEDETLVIGTEHEVGTAGREHVAAIWKDGALRPIPGKTVGRVVVAAIDARRSGVAFTPGAFVPKPKIWPPKVFSFEKDTFRPAAVPPEWTSATKGAREAFLPPMAE